VTGGSEGIGFALANELASRGLDVAIIALDEPRLTEAAASIAAKHRVRTLAVPFNFWTASDGDHAALQRRLEAEVESQGGMAVLVNNVGVFYRYAMPFDAADLSDDLRMLKLNCEPQVRMTKWAVPILKRKGCGAIVTTSSISAVLPAPYLSVYSGTKSFNRGFAQSLEAELLGTGVDTLIITPHVVNTRMAESVPKEKRRGTLMVDPEPLARDAISKLGVLTETAGHRFHCIVRAVFLALRSDRMKRTAVSRVKESYERCRQLDEERRSQTAASK
jgi:short-subunit dehydrogenase